MTATIKKRSIVMQGRKSSISLEDEFWNGFRELAYVKKLQLGEMAQNIDEGRKGNLSSAIRLAVLAHYRAQIPPRAEMPVSSPNHKPIPVVVG